MDFQNRVGHKTGSGMPLSREDINQERRERLKQLALENIDITKDPYILKNNVGMFECKLCLTLHNNESSYLCHTQGKKHQMNLAQRLLKEKNEITTNRLNKPVSEPRKIVKIGKPRYDVTRVRNKKNQLGILFELSFPNIKENTKPKFRFMSSFEQKIEAPDKKYQYLLFAAEPYETIAFKIPNIDIDENEGFYYKWFDKKKIFVMQIHFQNAFPPGHINLREHSNFLSSTNRW
ncbi:putative splicing factor 3A subunit 2 [Plasmodium gaboni]|uniref:Putative splicing factor 3A subunit 2 n=1 Tax=Plasmodium gaboni TaxID=647221 RepID=A0A151LRS8_9APIC|nr:putative splicing factor 3A subunit 2 [Plasmodium gaboni]KYO01893.1 putative splicing factor 3A subunit 2 [Plasmodium gaboni]SOV12349.1 splicing factor 3A subunit 2, putative [Plasmodium gaboni]SOV21705.1 splicing factor 3A subunit 2, putative [Plasmodium sp. DRC-Itaito]